MFAVEFPEGRPVRWETDGAGARSRPDPDYEPAFHVAARDDRTRYLDWAEGVLAGDPRVTALDRERHFLRLDAGERSPTLRVGLERVDEVRDVARRLRRREREAHAPGSVQCYDVDLDPGFRYCLDTGTDPTPDRELRTLDLSLSDRALADGDLSAIEVEGERAGRSERAACRAVERALADRDPDVLVVPSGEVIPLLDAAGVQVGREPGYRKRAGESTDTSYGRVGHSPARYAVPGRAIVDRSNSFLLGESGMAGLHYFVRRAGKPLQAVARDSIGGVLTSMEVRAARARDVLAPWQKRQTEAWKPLDTLHAADRGGHTLQPDVGVHADVHQLDFASLYPTIIREYGVSPETVACGCHDTADVPELGYSLCPASRHDGSRIRPALGADPAGGDDSVADPGDGPASDADDPAAADEDCFLGAVLGPLLDDRRRWKRRLREGDPDGAERRRLRDRVDAVKWVLVSCFGYQGYRHAKFGRIEVHEAINAVARDLLLRAKAAVEDAGWRVVHGIVDSLWVQPDPDREPRPIRAVASEVSDAVGIELEHEGRFDWLAFCPRKRASGAALMRYFGAWADGGYKFRGVEARQRSTSPFVADAQRDLVETFDAARAPDPVCERLRTHLAALRRGDPDPADLAVTTRVTRRAEEYEQATRARAALRRYAAAGIDRAPGQSVSYVVVDDAAAGAERVRLPFEAEGYDADCYADRLVRACASVLSPLGWDEGRVRQYLRADRDARLDAF